MALQGTCIKLPNGNLAIEYLSSDFNNPQLIRRVWEMPLGLCKSEGYCRHAIDDAIGKTAKLDQGKVSVYLGNGDYITCCLPFAGATPAIIVEITEAPKPKVRSNVQTRWHHGAWQKYTAKSGWIAA